MTGTPPDTAGTPVTGRRRHVLDALRSSASPWTIGDLAAHLGMHPNTARFHLEALEEQGRAERVTPRRSGPGRPPLTYRARAGMDPSGPRNYRLLAEILVSGAGETCGPAATGRAWAARRAGAPPSRRPSRAQAVGRLLEQLDGIGFAPETRGDAQLGLRHCPFLELAKDRTDVVCQAHLGLMQGTLDAMNAPVTVDSVQPFTEPGLCLAHLAPADEGEVQRPEAGRA